MTHDRLLYCNESRKQTQLKTGARRNLGKINVLRSMVEWFIESKSGLLLESNQIARALSCSFDSIKSVKLRWKVMDSCYWIICWYGKYLIHYMHAGNTHCLPCRSLSSWGTLRSERSFMWIAILSSSRKTSISTSNIVNQNQSAMKMQ